MKITMARLVSAGLAISAAGCASALITDVAQDKVESLGRTRRFGTAAVGGNNR